MYFVVFSAISLPSRFTENPSLCHTSSFCHIQQIVLAKTREMMETDLKCSGENAYKMLQQF